MNIAVSPDLALLSAPDPIPGILTGLPNGFTEIPFADLLGLPPESSPEAAPGPDSPKASPRKPAMDTTDPALITLLPFLAQQIPQTPPAPTLTAQPSGEGLGIATGNAANTLPTGSTAATGLPSASAVGTPPQIQAGYENQLPETTGYRASAGNLEHQSSNPGSMNFAGDVPAAGAIDRPSVRQFEQLRTPTNEPVQGPLIPREFASAFPFGSAAAAESAPAKDAAPPTMPGTNPPAEFSPAAASVATSATMLMNGTPAENHSGPRQPERNADAKAAPEADGTTAAMQPRVMPEQFTERTLKAKTNGPATPSETVQNRTVAVPGIPARNGTERRIEPEPAAEKRTLLRADAAVEKGAQLPAPVNAPGEAAAPTTAEATAAVRITRQTMDLAEHVRAMGRDHVEVQMRLRDGEEVTVSLRLEKGEWKPVFKTDSEALCRALEQNWNRAAAQPSAQAVRFGTPVFESQQTQTGGGRSGHPNGQQQPDARDRSFNRREQEPAFAIPAQPARTALTTATPNRTTATPAVQIYA